MNTYITPLFSYREFMAEMQRRLGQVPSPMPYTEHGMEMIASTLRAMLDHMFKTGQLVRIPEVFCSFDSGTKKVSVGFTNEFELEVMDCERPKITELPISASWET